MQGMSEINIMDQFIVFRKKFFVNQCIFNFFATNGLIFQLKYPKNKKSLIYRDFLF